MSQCVCGVVAICCGVLWSFAVCCGVYLRCVAVCICGVLRCVSVCCCVLQCVAVCCSVLQRVAACCGVLRCGAVWCGVLRCCECTRDCLTMHNNRLVASPPPVHQTQKNPASCIKMQTNANRFMCLPLTATHCIAQVHHIRNRQEPSATAGRGPACARG